MAILAKTECAKARKLWEEVFEEDTGKFLDYYDKYVADHNQIFAELEGEELVSMVQLNPYRVRMGVREADSAYIVAVATRRDCRHQGRMRHLLTEAMERMYQEKVPFTFLMPASESIYRPFDFVTVYRQSMFTCGTVMEGEDSHRWECIPCKKNQIPELVKWSNRFLQQHSQVATLRSREYYERIWKEQESMNGQILLFYEGSRMRGYCFTGYEGSGEAWEIAVEDAVLEKGRGEEHWQQDSPNADACQAKANRRAVEALTHWFAEKNQLPVRICGFLPGSFIEGISEKEMAYRPMTMVRVIHLEEWIKRLRAREELTFDLKITDPILKENNGTFQFRIGKESASLTETKNRKAPEMTVAELTAAVFGTMRTDRLPQDQIECLDTVYLNEMV